MQPAPTPGQYVRLRPGISGPFVLCDPSGRAAIIITAETRLRIVPAADGVMARAEGSDATIRIDPDFMELCDE